MTKKIKVSIPEFVPKGCVLLTEFLDRNAREITLGATVRVQFQKYEAWFDATVQKIVADESTGEVREVTIIMVKDPAFRTVTPDKLRRIPTDRQEEDEMKVEAFKGELPARKRAGKVRQPNPFDTHIAAGGTHKVTLEKGDDVKAIKTQLSRAAAFGKVSVETFHDEAAKQILFKVVPRKTRTAKPAAPVTE